MGPGVTLTGDRELAQALNSLGSRVYRKHVERVIRQETKPLIRAIRANIRTGGRRRSKTPTTAASPPTSRTGNLRRSIGAAVRRYAAQRTIAAIVGPRTAGQFGTAGRHGHLIEFGHRLVRGGTTARISPGRAGRVDPARNRKRTGQGRVAGKVPPHPFMRPAFESQKGALLNDMLRKIWASVEKEAAKKG